MCVVMYEKMWVNKWGRSEINKIVINVIFIGKIWKSKNISFPTKMELYKILVLSILLYGCESWTLIAETTKRVQTFETKCFRRLLGISWGEHKTKDFVHGQVTLLAGPQEPLLAAVRKRKLLWLGHVIRHNTLPRTVLQGTLEVGRRRGRQSKNWMDNIKEWTKMDTPTLRQKTDLVGSGWLHHRSPSFLYDRFGHEKERRKKEEGRKDFHH